MLRPNKLKSQKSFGKSSNDYPKTTLVYKPLSAYIAGASDVTGKALQDGPSSMFDTVPTDSKSVPLVDPWCDSHSDIFTHVEAAPDFAQQIAEQVGTQSQIQTE